MVSRHGSDRVQRRPRGTTMIAVAGMAALLAGGLVVAARHPIAADVASVAPVDSAGTARYPTGGSTLSAAATPATSVTPTELPVAPALSPTSSLPTTPPAPQPTEPAAPGVASAVRPSPPPAAASESTPQAGRSAPAIASGEPCRPVRFALPDLAIDASVVTLALTADGDLGTPNDQDKTSAGWFPSVLAGTGRGTVLMDGHTYHDGSAIFPLTFKEQVQVGMKITLSCADGHAFSYRISQRVVDLSPTSYPPFVTSTKLYAADGPPQLVMITCTDYLPAQRVWANRAVVIATPLD